MNSFLKILFVFALLSFPSLAQSPDQSNMTRQRVLFTNDWKFVLAADTTAYEVSFDDSAWRKLNLPHDWSIELPFDQHAAAGVGGGALPGGTGWYRKAFELPANDKGKQVFIDFDGIYCNSEVWINGYHLGKRPNGYISFRYELTPHLVFGKKNVIVVKVDNSMQPNSRWYSGSGIYRNVWLVKTEAIHVANWGTYVTTPSVSAASARADIEITINNTTGSGKNVTIETVVFDAKGNKAGTSGSTAVELTSPVHRMNQSIQIAAPVIWTTNNPVLYKAVTTIRLKKKQLDVYETTFGIRTFEFDAQKGFSLNGERLKILGVCNHHDLGCLGAAINERAIERQLEILRGMGVNAIRTSHNPPAPELLDLCDKMGFLVMDESFDMWKKQKSKYDYSNVWDEWHKRDLEDFIRRDRNHPSIIAWSVGNEIGEQWDTTGVSITRELVGIVKSLDKTRPVTTANNEVKPHNNLIKSGALDLIGFNYHHEDFAPFPQTYPGQKFIGTETTSALETRGHYDMPSDSVRRWPLSWDKVFTEGNKDNTVSAYDNVSAPWGSTHEETWKIIKKYDHLSGMFIWTGFDYLGEPTPYIWPSRSSYFGVIDLAGFPKDVYYMYKSEWTAEPVLHVFPHWNWKPGQVVDLWVYYSQADEVELFINGVSKGVRRKVGDDLHVMWRVSFEPGTVRVVSRRNGKEVLVKEVKTAGVPARIVLEADRNSIKADGRDLSFITVKILDANGNVVPDADNKINFTVAGSGFVAGVDNGDPTSHESFKDDSRNAFHGLALVVIQSNGTKGEVSITATSDDLKEAVIKVMTK
jgi:beta-galactosidase